MDDRLYSTIADIEQYVNRSCETFCLALGQAYLEGKELAALKASYNNVKSILGTLTAVREQIKYFYPKTK